MTVEGVPGQKDTYPSLEELGLEARSYTAAVMAGNAGLTLSASVFMRAHGDSVGNKLADFLPEDITDNPDARAHSTFTFIKDPALAAADEVNPQSDLAALMVSTEGMLHLEKPAGSNSFIIAHHEEPGTLYIYFWNASTAYGALDNTDPRRFLGLQALYTAAIDRADQTGCNTIKFRTFADDTDLIELYQKIPGVQAAPYENDPTKVLFTVSTEQLAEALTAINKLAQRLGG